MNSFEQLAAIRERQLDAGFLYYRPLEVRDLSVPLVLEFVWHADGRSPVLNAFLEIMQAVKGIS